jgi:predicted transcriptional regulator of viral defense system
MRPSPLQPIDSKKEAIEALFDASNSHIFGNRELNLFLQRITQVVFYSDQIPIQYLKSYLLRKSHLKKIVFKTPRNEILYIWRSVDNYELLPKIRSNGYYTHLSALYFHDLLDYEPENVYFNHEQAARISSANTLEQSRIDNAFQKNQRLTTARTVYDDKEYWLLNGKQTGNYGVSVMEIPSGAKVSVTNLERTLIDITVRPAYAGGVNSVLNAYRLAQPQVSVKKLIKTLRCLDYVYPYYQSIGFYLELAGNYPTRTIQALEDYDTFRHNFYVDYEIKDPTYSPKWRIYYPNNLT